MRITFFGAFPDDCNFDKKWGLHNEGQEVNHVTGDNDVGIDAGETADVARQIGFVPGWFWVWSVVRLGLVGSSFGFVLEAEPRF